MQASEKMTLWLQCIFCSARCLLLFFFFFFFVFLGGGGLSLHLVCEISECSTRLRGCMVFTGRLCEKYHNLAASRENLPSGFLTGRDLDLSHQLQRLARY